MTTYNVFPDQLPAATDVAGDDLFLVYDTSTGLMKDVTSQVMQQQSYVAIPDAATYTVLAANSGKVHVLPNLTADIVITMPAEAAGLNFEFIYAGAAADAQDWLLDTGSNTNYFAGGVVHLDADAGTGADEVVPVYSDGNSNSKFTVLVPEAGTWVKVWSNGTIWYITGTVVAATAPSFADQ